jgi:BNR/Asp-box repeat
VANSTIIYACTDDGLAIFNKPGTLPEWLPPRMALQGKRVLAAWGEPGPPVRVVVVADGVLMLSENGGRTWDLVGPEGVEGVKVLNLDYDEAGHSLKAVTHDGGIWVSTDGGATWQIATRKESRQGDVSETYSAQMPPGSSVSMVIPGSGGTLPALLAGTPDGIQVSADGGDSWTGAVLPHKGSVTALARDPERRDRLYAASAAGYLFESGNRGRTWQAINREAIAPVATLFVLRI